jgi:hypothetical protein
MVGATENAVDFRMDNTSSTCDTFEEVFSEATAYSKEKYETMERFAEAQASSGGRLSAPPPTDTPAPTSTPVPATVTPITGSGSDQEYHLNPECNPWIDGPGKCPDDNDGTLCSRRVIIIPVIDSFGNGSEDVTIIRFALMFLEGYGDDGCNGNDCEVQGRFVRAEVTTGALSGVYDPEASIQFTRLSE